jgi:hypothetical protein
VRNLEALKAPGYFNYLKTIKIGLYLGIIIFSVVSFAYNGVLRNLNIVPSSFYSADFPRFYGAGQLWNEGLNPYDYKLLFARIGSLVGIETALQSSPAYYYPPQATVVFSWFSQLPFPIARLTLLGRNLGLIRRSCFQDIELTSNSGTICLELVKKLQDAGYHLTQVPVHHYHRAYGKSQFYNFPRLWRTGVNLLNLWWRLMVKQEHRRYQLERLKAHRLEQLQTVVAASADSGQD